MHFNVNKENALQHPIVASLIEAYRKKATVSVDSVIVTNPKLGTDGPSLVLNVIIDHNPIPTYPGTLEKYILCLRLLNAGKSATIDLVRIEATEHKYILWSHANKLNAWPDDINPHAETDHESYVVPFLVAGGKIRKDNEGQFLFYDKSGGFGSVLLGCDVHDLAREIHSLCCKSDDGDFSGETIVSGLLAFMSENSGAGFYERFAERYPMKKDVHFRAIGAMKALDESASATK